MLAPLGTAVDRGGASTAGTKGNDILHTITRDSILVLFGHNQQNTQPDKAASIMWLCECLLTSNSVVLADEFESVLGLLYYNTSDANVARAL